MNTNQLKKFAQEARRKLLEQVGAKLSFVLTTDSAELREKTEQLKQLREELGRTTKEQLIEKVAYTWFNRLMALRFMDANEYQPLGIRIITPKDGYTIPELLDEAKRGNIPEELKLKRQKVYDLLDNRIPSTNPQNEAFKELLIASCNNLNTIFPFLFEKINDYTELLVPDDLTSDFSIVTDIRKGMPVEDCKNVEIIGWLYQFYISERKDEVFASKAKVKKEDIPAATQLFTPRWIVEYMVQNTVGKLWLQNRPKSKLREHMPYFMESASLTSDDFLRIDSPEEIKLADPASGSGHILVYAFDLFTKIYEEEGYNTSDIPKLIIEKNLYGFEIDERAAQLSGLALMMKAREYQRRALKKDLRLNILCFQDLHLDSNEIRETLDSLQIKISDELLHDLLQIQQATNFGSLIIPHAHKNELIQIFKKLNQLASSADVFQRSKIDAFSDTLNQLIRLSEKYHCVVTNPPYMSGGNMNKKLSEFVKTNYPDSKTDLMACFMESGFSMLKPNGFLGMINQHSWMFLSSYEELRKKLIKNNFYDTLLHLGARTFPEIGGEVVQNTAFTFWKNSFRGNGSYIRLVDLDNSELKRTKTLEAIQNQNCGWFYIANQKDFEKIPSSRIGFWLSNKAILNFTDKRSLNEISNGKSGMSSCNSDRFLRKWHEVNISTVKFDCTSNEDIKNLSESWFPYNKGGGSRKWYGYNDILLYWKNEGESIKNFVVNNPKDPNTSHWSRRLFNLEYFFQSGLTWSAVTSSNLSMRIVPNGVIPGTGSKSLYGLDNHSKIVVMGILNSKVADYYLSVFSPTLNFEAGDVGQVPIVTEISFGSDIINRCISLSQDEWDSSELSYNFQHNSIIRFKGQDLEDSYDLYQQYWKNKFIQLHQNEEELNRQIIEVYGLQDELTPIVLLNSITILQEELDRKELTKLNKKLIRVPNTLAAQNYHEIDLPFIAKEVIAQFISYSMGCIFGRYSLDKEGLILANQGESLQYYLDKITKAKNECVFLPDDDNIIPILDDEWFEDDIVGRFYQFLKATFGEMNFNKNLAFIEEQIGKDIRKYFMKDFYPDHIKRYKKRPIYWMFSSANGHFNALIYMHRYTPDTVSNILNKYLKEFIGKLNTRNEHLHHVQVSGSPAEKTKAIKESDNIDKMLIELQEYERDVLYPLATERIAIDLDDGVLVNYNKFGKAVKDVSGLNDKKTKDKVRKFDWIDVAQIR